MKMLYYAKPYQKTIYPVMDPFVECVITDSMKMDSIIAYMDHLSIKKIKIRNAIIGFLQTQTLDSIKKEEERLIMDLNDSIEKD